MKLTENNFASSGGSAVPVKLPVRCMFKHAETSFIIQMLTIGTKINRLTLVAILAPRKGHKMAEWVCECGNPVICRISAVVTGNTKACGCLNKEMFSKVRNDSYKHGLSKSPEHRSWRHMHGRCYNPHDPKFKTYGARGIVICDQWKGERGFENFFSDMGQKPTPNHSIERVDVNGNYEPSNCIWATLAVQAKNKTNTVRLTIDGTKTYQREFAKAINVSPGSINYHLKRGKTPEQIRDYFSKKDLTHAP